MIYRKLSLVVAMIFCVFVLTACNSKPKSSTISVSQKILGEWVVFADGVGRGDTGKLVLKEDGTFDSTYTVEQKTDRYSGTFTVTEINLEGEKIPCVALSVKDDKERPNEIRLLFDQSNNLLHDLLTTFYCRPDEIEKARKSIERPETPKTAVVARTITTKVLWSKEVVPHEIDHYGIAAGDFLGNGKQLVVATHAKGFTVFDAIGNSIGGKKVGDIRGGHLAMGRYKGKSVLVEFDTWGHEIVAMDMKGDTIWKFDAKDSGIDWLTPVIVDDANTGYFVGYNGGGGVQFLNPDGSEKWIKPADWNVWNVATLKRGRGNPDYMVCVGPNENAIVFDNKGTQIRDIKMGDIGAVGGADLDQDGTDEVLGLGTTVVSGQKLFVTDQVGKPWWFQPANASDSIHLDKAFLTGKFNSTGTLLGVCEQGGILFFRPDGQVFGKIDMYSTAACVLQQKGQPDRLVLHQGKRIVCLALGN